MAIFTSDQIREKIESNISTMQKLFNPSQFTLNEEYEALRKENEYLQSICEHEFHNGICIYCKVRSK